MNSVNGLGESLNSILIASNTQKTFAIVSSLLKAIAFERIVTAASAAEAKRALLDANYDLVVVDTPLTDELGDEVALKALEEGIGGVIIIVDESIYYDVNANLEDTGVFVLPKSISSMFFYQTCRLLLSSRKRIRSLEERLEAMSLKVEEEHIIGRAKCLLVEHLGYSESKAHRYIEKEAMNKRLSKVLVARDIIRAYDFTGSIK